MKKNGKNRHDKMMIKWGWRRDDWTLKLKWSFFSFSSTKSTKARKLATLITLHHYKKNIETWRPGSATKCASCKNLMITYLISIHNVIWHQADSYSPLAVRCGSYCRYVGYPLHVICFKVVITLLKYTQHFLFTWNIQFLKTTINVQQLQCIC